MPKGVQKNKQNVLNCTKCEKVCKICKANKKSTNPTGIVRHSRLVDRGIFILDEG